MEIPLFPLHTVLCPGIVLPLHIFEDRYRAMTRRCLDTGEPFGVVLIRDGREIGTARMATLAGVGVFAEIRQAGRYPDGRFDLLAAATGRFAIELVDAQTEPYLLAEVTPLDDEVGDEPRAERLAAAAIRRFVRYLDLMRARDGETTEVLDIRVEIESQTDDVGDRIPGRPEMEGLEGEGSTPEPTPDLHYPRRPDRALVPALRHRAGRAAAPPGAARSGDDRRTPGRAGLTPRTRARAPDQAPALLHAGSGEPRRRAPKLTKRRAGGWRPISRR